LALEQLVVVVVEVEDVNYMALLDLHEHTQG